MVAGRGQSVLWCWPGPHLPDTAGFAVQGVELLGSPQVVMGLQLTNDGAEVIATGGGAAQ